MSEKLEIELSLLRRMCKYFTISCDRYGSCRGDSLELACHHEASKPKGSSWGICSAENCPYLKEKCHA